MDQVFKKVRFDKKTRMSVWNKYDGHCAYCGIPLKIKDMQVDHLKPLHLDGSNDMENLMPSCRLCNIYKRVSTIENFRNHIESVPETLRKYDSSFNVAERFGMIRQDKEHVKFYFEEKNND